MVAAGGHLSPERRGLHSADGIALHAVDTCRAAVAGVRSASEGSRAGNRESHGVGIWERREEWVIRKPLTTGQNQVHQVSYGTDSITPGANRLVLAFLLQATNQPAILPTATGNGLTWKVVQSVSIGDGGNWRLTCFRAMKPSAPSEGPVTFTFSDQLQGFVAWSIIEYDGVDTSGADGEGAVVQSAQATGVGSNLSVPLGGFAEAAYDWAVGGLGLADAKAIPQSPGFSKIHEQNVVQTGS